MKGVNSTVLSCIGAIGVVATSVLAVKETPKAIKLCEALRLERINNYEPEPTKLEYVKEAWKCYIPAAAVGLSTVACIFGANALNKRHQATLVSACMLAENVYKEYKNKVKTVLRNDTDAQLVEAMARDDVEEEIEPVSDEGVILFYDPCLGYFESTLESVELDDGLECFIIDVAPSISRK